jgi:RNA polymerase sigma-70 factor (ECF subfamily)
MQNGHSGAIHVRPSEPDLIERAQLRDSGAFEELVLGTRNGLYRLAIHYVHNDSDAQEVLQNAYLSAWRSLPTFEGRAGFASWMYRITVNASLMFIRARNRSMEIAVTDIQAIDFNDTMDHATQTSRAGYAQSHRPDEDFQSAELRARIERAVNSLPKNLKKVFLLRQVRELSTEDSAARMGVSIGTAKTRLHRAHKVLRESLGDCLPS